MRALSGRREGERGIFVGAFVPFDFWLLAFAPVLSLAQRAVVMRTPDGWLLLDGEKFLARIRDVGMSSCVASVRVSTQVDNADFMLETWDL